MRAIIMIPTYNEAQNIGSLIESIFGLTLDSHDYLEIVVVDDNSPDGTAEIVRDLQKKFPDQLHLIVRTDERGRGTAGIKGFEYCLQKDVDCILEMDADFSHHPSYLPELLRLIQSYDLVIGSRFVPGGKDLNRTWTRMVVSLLANWIYRTLLGLNIKDLSSGFKCYRKELMQKLQFENFYSHGYAIGMETVFRCHERGARMIETPIHFENRKFGKSKFSFKEILESLRVSSKLALSRFL